MPEEIPMILERHYFRSRLLPGLVPDDVAMSVYEMINQKYHYVFSEVVETIRTIPNESHNASLLNVPAGTPGFLMFFIPINEQGMPIYFAEVIYRGDAYEFHNRLGPIWKSHPIDEDPGDFRAPGHGPESPINATT